MKPIPFSVSAQTEQLASRWQQSAIHEMVTFHFDADSEDSCVLRLMACLPGSMSEATSLWSCRFEIAENRDAVLSRIESGALDPVFLGRCAMMFGSEKIDHLIGKIIAEIRREQVTALNEANDLARQHRVVCLYARETKRGGYTLELERDSRSRPDWKVSYDRASERDRLCDWLRWQKPRFLDFLDYAAEHGSEALARLLTDEMFETERRVKSEGRGAGGMRPLRMWRGD